jgi:hypothetical protein
MYVTTKANAATHTTPGLPGGEQRISFHNPKTASRSIRVALGNLSHSCEQQGKLIHHTTLLSATHTQAIEGGAPRCTARHLEIKLGE